MKIILEVQRYNPHADAKPYCQRFAVEAEPTELVLSVLMRIQETLDPTLSFRKSCAHGVCGSDGMMIAGKERLACKTLVKDVLENPNEPIRIEPLRNLPVQRDLMVDQAGFFDTYAKVKPFLVNDEEPPAKERLQSPAEHKKIENGTNCILCASCCSACPVLGERADAFLGPAAIVQAARFNEDTRDRGFAQRLPVLDQPDGVWPCENHFACTRVCPRGIKVTKHINLTKRRIEKHNKGE